MISLVPAATEIVAALGSASSLVAISHECDWPPSLRHLPRITTTPVDVAQSSGAIDALVRSLHASGRPVIAIDGALLARLRPDLLLTQNLCEVCAVADGGMVELASLLDPRPAIHSMTGRTLAGVFADIEGLAIALGVQEEGVELVLAMRSRLSRLPGPNHASRPRVAIIEWLDPVYLAGHWVPDLVAAAGGEDIGAEAGAHSRVTTLEAVSELRPDLLVVAPCGFGLEPAGREFVAFEERIRESGGKPPTDWGIPVWLLDGNAYTSRPGPRLADAALRINSILAGREMDGVIRVTPGFGS